MSTLRVDNITNEAGSGAPLISYDSSSSGLNASDIQAAIDEVLNKAGAPQPGQIIECLSNVCDGSTVEGVSGTYTWPTVSGTQTTTDSYQLLNGSNIDYQPPAGTSRVQYEYTYHKSSSAGTDARAIVHYRFYLDNNEIIYARHTREEDQAEDAQQTFRWTINVGGIDDNNTGRVSTWDAPKELKLEYRRYNSSYDATFHELNWFDGSGSNLFHMPRLTITAIA